MPPRSIVYVTLDTLQPAYVNGRTVPPTSGRPICTVRPLPSGAVAPMLFVAVREFVPPPGVVGETELPCSMLNNGW